MYKKIFFVVLIIIVSAFSGILANRYLFPRLLSTKFFSKYDFLKKPSQEVTVINKTEQVFVKEESSVTKLANSISPSMVNITSVMNSATKSEGIKTTLNGAYKNGTGMIVTSDGIIMTYLSSVFPENAAYKITAHDGNVYDAELWAVDAYSNLVFLKVNASNLPVVSFKNSDELSPGEKIIAIGNNGERYQNQFSSGLLSSFNADFNLSGKTLGFSEKLQGVFEMDISNAEKYVGGPAIDFSGQSIGVVGKVEKDNEEAYFVIPANKVKVVMDRSLKKETAETPVFGAYYLPVTKTLALANSLGTEKGALIYSPSGQRGLSVIAGTPADQANLLVGDIIVRVNDDEITLENSLSDLIYRYKKGAEIELIILRVGTELKVKVQL